MAATIAEKLGSGDTTNDQKDVLYIIQETTDEEVAYALLAATAPTTLDGKARNSLSVSNIKDSNSLWIGEVSYINPDLVDEPEVGTNTFSFSTGGGSRHITQARSVQAKYPEGAPDRKGAVGVAADGSVNGIDLDDSIYKWSMTLSIADAKVDNAYKARLAGLTNSVNNDTFDGHAAGSVKFEGASGSKRGDGNWDITYSFAAIQNVKDAIIGDIEDIDKDGWDYLEVAYKTVEDGGKLVSQPSAVYVSQVYPTGDFAQLSPDYAG